MARLVSLFLQALLLGLLLSSAQACAAGDAQLVSESPLSQNPAPSRDMSLSSEQRHNREFVWELDPYYSEVSLHIPLTDDPIPELSDVSEFEVYARLLAGSLVPRYMLVEAAVFPMPLAGVALKRYATDFYRAFDVGSRDFNLLEAVTEGFQEPYAVSALFGNIVSFVRPGEEKICSNKGYTGYMVSYSNQHIKRNELIPDNNLEVEWKTKGDRNFRDDKLSWSFRIGAKLHGNPHITDTLYLGFRRNNLDFKADFLSFLKNSDVNTRWDFSSKDGRLLRQEYVVGKKIPLTRWRFALRLDLGVIWEKADMYSGSLRDRDFQSVRAVIRPNLEF